MEYLSISINPPPLDVKIIVKKAKFTFDDGARLRIMKNELWTQSGAVQHLIDDGFELWSKV